jgi:hypothetical protein
MPKGVFLNCNMRGGQVRGRRMRGAGGNRLRADGEEDEAAVFDWD